MGHYRAQNQLPVIIIYFFHQQMGKKGVLLDNGKKAQSSMALYWKAGRQKSIPKPQRVEKHQQKQQDIQMNAVVGLQKWKQHKEKMITKLYTKAEKKPQVEQVDEAQIEKKREEELQQELLQKQLHKNKPIYIPGFKGADQLKKKMQYETVKLSNQETNKLKFPAGQEALTQQEIIQFLREKKARKELDKKNKSRVQRSGRIKQQVQIDDFLMNQEQNTLKELKQTQRVREEEQKKRMLKQQQQKVIDNANFFKSQLLQRIVNGQNVFKKKEAGVESVKQVSLVEVEAQEMVSNKPRFIPRALWNK